MVLDARLGNPEISRILTDVSFEMTAKDVARAIKEYRIDSEKPNPTGV